MNRAVMVTKMSDELIDIRPDGSAVAKAWPDLPPVEWYVRGPRGGLYLATGARTRTVFQSGSDFVMNTWSVVDRSEGARYISPSRERARA